MAEYLDKMLADLEEMCVLPEDGRSNVLAVALLCVDWKTKITPEAGARDIEETCSAK
jgi:hypothetical protein